jgi:hypothetical protein
MEQYDMEAHKPIILPALSWYRFTQLKYKLVTYVVTLFKI